VTGRGEPIRIELRDAADAADLMRELEGAVPAELRATESGRWEIAVSPAGPGVQLLSDLLGRVQEWLDRSRAGVVTIRFRGRAYTLESVDEPRPNDSFVPS
jgi:hypothetical protein